MVVTTNPFVEEIKKCINEEVAVTVYTPDKTETLKGKCIALDFINKSIVIQTDEEIVMIPRYIYLVRTRS